MKIREVTKANRALEVEIGYLMDDTGQAFLAMKDEADASEFFNHYCGQWAVLQLLRKKNGSFVPILTPHALAMMKGND